MRAAPDHVDEARRRLVTTLPVGEHRLDVAGVSTAIVEGGAGPPLVLLHGPGGNHTHWAQVLPALMATNRVVAPDLPGHGASAAVDADTVLAWLAELIELTCPTPPTQVGNALGGAIAARFAATSPGALSGLVLVDALGLADFDPAPAFGRALIEFLAEPIEQSHDALWSY
jgi:pimeloyl-ACP methyl ester carboxylesterase